MTCCLPVPSTMGTGEEVASILGVRHDMLFISTLETNQDSISRHPTIPISLTPLPPLWCGNIEVKESGAMRGVGGGGKLPLLLLMAFAQGWLVRDTGYGIGTGYGIPDTGPSVSVIRTDHPVLKGFVFVKVQFASLRRARTRQSCCSRSFCANSCGSGRKEHSPRLVVSHSTCPPLSSSPHAHSFVIGPAVIKHTQGTGPLSRATKIGDVLPWEDVAPQSPK